LVYPIIPDEATQIAALRTGNIDFMYPVQSRHWSDLAETAPEIESSKVPAGRGTVIALNTTDAPVNDVAVRRALMVGTDLRAFHDLHGDVGVLPLHWYPKAPGDPSTYTPLEELPEDVRVLYEYDPELAKEMLAEAGYPNGFELTYTTLSEPASMVDRASLLADMWGDIGVVVNIETVDRPTWSRIAITERGTFEDSIIDFPSTASPFEVVWRGASDGRNNIFNWSNDRFDALAVQIMGELDPVRRGEMIKEAGLIALREASNIPTDPTPTGHFWWPWIRNYFGERNVQDNNFEPVLARAWLDEEMKADMGF
jgi:peptide/nickel transport system substrate-binding protein